MLYEYEITARKAVDSMKRKVFIFSVAAVAVVFAGLAVTFYALGASPAAVAEPAEAAARQYVVRAKSGKITVFPGDSKIPEIETEIDTSRLRAYDRELLENGIEIEGYENMISLLEDFSN